MYVTLPTAESLQRTALMSVSLGLRQTRLILASAASEIYIPPVIGYLAWSVVDCPAITSTSTPSGQVSPSSATVGKKLYVIENEWVGPRVGAGVVGDVVGAFVGDDVGFADGLVVGADVVGECVGDVVGAFVGDNVGFAVGLVVGADVVGDPVGADVVGAAVGDAVGLCVHECGAPSAGTILTHKSGGRSCGTPSFQGCPSITQSPVRPSGSKVSAPIVQKSGGNWRLTSQKPLSISSSETV